MGCLTSIDMTNIESNEHTKKGDNYTIKGVNYTKRGDNYTKKGKRTFVRKLRDNVPYEKDI